MSSTRTLITPILCWLVLVLLTACTPAGGRSSTIRLFAASSLHDAMNQAMTAFQQQHPEVEFQSNYASSAQLAIQLSQGAEADVFASADLDQMSFAQNSGEIGSSPVIFATNQLLILVPADNPADVHQVADLANDGVRLILTVPGTPLRAYSDQVLSILAAERQDGEELVSRILENVVSEEENARQAVAKIALGEADAAFAYRSDAVSELSQDSLLIQLPDSLQLQAEYPIALTVEGQANPLAVDFVEFMLSPEGQRILTRWGFGIQPQQ